VEVARERPGLRLAIDTFSVEPLPAASPLRALPNAILTPHLVGHTQESMAAIPGAALENILCVLRGEVPGSTVNPGIAPVWRQRWGKA
jgi:phosphoglycerate dehydrogenase-like enzyme